MIYVLIPALIASEESERLLRATIQHVPQLANAVVVVVSQGQRPALQKTSNISDLVQIHYDAPMTKWAALVRARQVTSDSTAQVVLLDADDPISPESFADSLVECASYPEACWIGSRPGISLFAADAISSDSRFFIEVFSNTLLLNKFKSSKYLLKEPPDVQSGFYTLPAALFCSLDFAYVQHYGGELAMFHQILQIQTPVRSIPYVAQPRNASSYRMDQIIREIVRLPFFCTVTARAIKKAATMAPNIYARYFDKGRLAKYELEMPHILSVWNSELGARHSAP